LRILLVDVDGKLPNLALMKLSTWHKKHGDQTFLLRLTKYWRKGLGKPISLQINPKVFEVDKAYISCIFSKNKSKALSVKTFLETLGVEVEVGGVGIDLKKELPPEIEHYMPDYELYPNVDYSLGYTSRGCIRKCPWCLVWRKEGWIKPWADLREFLHPKHKKVILLDNNLLASPNWEKVLTDLIVEQVKVCFTQGLDIRLIESDNIKYLKLCKYYENTWRRRRLYFSFDLPELEEEVVAGINKLVKKGIPPSNLMFYVLVGFGVKPQDYTWEYFLENDYHRFEVLRRLKVLPYIMVYNDRRDIPILKHFQRWVNKHYYNSYSFSSYLKHKPT